MSTQGALQALRQHPGVGERPGPLSARPTHPGPADTPLGAVAEMGQAPAGAGVPAWAARGAGVIRLCWADGGPDSRLAAAERRAPGSRDRTADRPGGVGT